MYRFYRKQNDLNDSNIQTSEELDIVPLLFVDVNLGEGKLNGCHNLF